MTYHKTYRNPLTYRNPQVIHNGEIYNHRALREKELAQFAMRTTCDSEVR